MFEGEQGLISALDTNPDSFQNNDIDHRALRGAERGTGHAGDARPDLAHHRAVSRARHRRGTDDGCALLGWIRGLGHRPRRSGSLARRCDRLHRGGRRDHSRPQQERAQLHGVARSCGLREAQGGLGERWSQTTAASTPIAVLPTRGCCTARATPPSRPPAAAACIPTARSGCASRAKRSGQASYRETSTVLM